MEIGSTSYAPQSASFHAENSAPPPASAPTDEALSTNQGAEVRASTTASASAIAMSATSDPVLTNPALIDEFTREVSGRLDKLPSKDFFPGVKADKAKAQDIFIMDLPDATLPDKGAESGPGPVVVGSVREIVGTIVSGLSSWGSHDQKTWVYVKTDEDGGEHFVPARQGIDQAVAWTRGEGLPENADRTIAKQVCEAILSDGTTLLTEHAKWHKEALLSCTADTMQKGATTSMLKLMRRVCEVPTHESRLDDKGQRIYAHTVRMKDDRGVETPVPGMVVISSGLSTKSTSEDREGAQKKTAVLYCTGMTSSFKTTTLFGFENSLREFEKAPKATPLSAFPDKTGSLLEMLQAYWPLITRNDSHDARDAVTVELVPCEGDIFEQMTRDAATVVESRLRSDAIAPDFTSEAVAHRMWRAWLAASHDPRSAQSPTLSSSEADRGISLADVLLTTDAENAARIRRALGERGRTESFFH